MKNTRTKNNGSIWLGILLLIIAGFLLTSYIVAVTGRMSDNKTARAQSESYASVQASANRRYEVEAKELGLSDRYYIETTAANKKLEIKTTAATEKLEIRTQASVSYSDRFFDFLEHVLTPLNILLGSALFLLRLLIISRRNRPAPPPIPAPIIIYKEQSRVEVEGMQLDYYRELEM